MPDAADPVIALDVGGMSIRSATVSDGRVGPIRRRPIDHRAPADELVAALAGAIEVHRPSEGQSVAIAIPDPFDHDRGVSLMTHKFASLHGVDLRGEIAAALDLSEPTIVFVNDAAAAGAGEVVGRQGRTLVLTLGTGLGASLFDGETLVREVDGLTVGDLWSTPWPLDERADESSPLADTRFSATGLADALDTVPAQLPAVVADPGRADQLRAWAHDLGDFIDEMSHRMSVDAVLLGGGAANGFEHFARWVTERTAVAVDQATLGASAPLLGASTLAFGA